MSRSIIFPYVGSRPTLLIILQEEYYNYHCPNNHEPQATWSSNPSSWHMLDWFVSNHIFSDSICLTMFFFCPTSVADMASSVRALNSENTNESL